jgi:hypothetical protein
MDKHDLHSIIDSVLAFLAGITPAALGAGISLLYEKGLSWGDRFARLAVGITVSWFASGIFAALCRFLWKVELDAFVLQGVGFVFGMIAYKATPGFITSASTAVAGIPGAILSWLPKGKDPQ